MPRQEGETLNLGDTAEPSNFSLQKLSWTQTIFQVRMRCNKSKSLLSFFKKCGYLHDNAVSLSTSFCFGFKTENVNISGFGLRKLRHKIVNKSPYQLLIRYRYQKTKTKIPRNFFIIRKFYLFWAVNIDIGLCQEIKGKNSSSSKAG